MNWIKTSDDLPIEGQIVLIRMVTEQGGETYLTAHRRKVWGLLAVRHGKQPTETAVIGMSAQLEGGLFEPEQAARITHWADIKPPSN